VPRVLAAVGLASLCGCGASSGSGGDENSSSSSTDPGTTDAMSSSSESSSSTDIADESTDASGGGSSSTGDPPTPFCGDAHVDAGEMCDDGNIEDGDGCDFDCTLSDPAQWSYFGGEYTSLRALAIGPEGEVLAGGMSGNLFDFLGDDQALLRALDPDGNVVAQEDELVPGDSYVFDVGRDPDGRYWLFGARINNAWIYRVDDRESDQVNFGTLEDIESATFGRDGIAVGSWQDVALLDAMTGDVIWQEVVGWVEDVAVAANGDIVVIGSAMYEDPRQLLRFSSDGTPLGEPIALGDMTECAVAANASGIAVVGMLPQDGMIVTSEVRVFADDGALLWSEQLADTQLISVTALEDTFVLVGGIVVEGWPMPAGMQFTADGTETWTFMTDATDYGVSAGLFSDAELAPDGSVIFAGDLYDVDVDPFEPPSHAFIVRRPPPL
jgi:cysteine-rich repeat protein